MLAQVERGDVNPTISVLWKIANGYKVSFTSLLEQETEAATVIRERETEPILADQGRYSNYPAFPFDKDRLFETHRILIAPGGRLEAQPHLAGTEEYITVFAGAVTIAAESDIFCLNRGDSLRFRADVPHAYANGGTEQAELSMLICYSK